MPNETVRVVREQPPSHVRAIAADNNRAALRLEAQGLLDAQPELTVRKQGYTREQADIMRQAVQQGALKLPGLREIRVEDPYSGSRRIEFIGDDESRWMHEYMHPLKVGKFGEGKQFASPKTWWQK